MNFGGGFLWGWAKGTLVGGLALIVGFLVFETATVLGLPTWMCAGFGAWALLCALAIGKP